MPVGPLYRLGLLVVAVAMVLLPLIYVALVVAFGWGVWWHASHNAAIFEGRGGVKGKLLLYLAPIVVGGVVLLFMLKPLLARPGRPRPRLIVGPEDEPLLHSFVTRIATAVGAPSPREIVVDCDVNASAGFRRGFLSFFGRDLTLTVGLPLIAGLDLRQLAGVLAHEFGHFAQGTGMRLTYVIRSVNAWFARVVYERDAWDEGLVRWAKETDLRIGIILHLARLMVWVTRRILWGLMICGHAVSCFMLRQMEFDADRYEARLVGSDAQGPTSLRIRLLALSSNASFSDLGDSWKDGRLADDFPALVVGNLSRMPDHVRRDVEKTSLEERTGVFDTHPSDADRARNALAEKSPGVFRPEGAATVLFRDFAETSRQATAIMYREMIGDPFTRETLVPTSAILHGQDEAEEDRRALRRYFQDCLDVEDLPTVAPGLEPLGDPADAIDGIRKLRARIEDAVPRARILHRDVRALEGRIAQLRIARTLKEAGVPISANEVELPSTSFPDIDAATSEAVARREALLAKVSPLASALRRRWELALRLLVSPAGAAVMDGTGTEPGRLRDLLAAQAALGAHRDVLLLLEQTCLANRALAGALGGRPDEGPSRRILAAVGRGVEDWRRQLTALRDGLVTTSFPFDHPRGRVSIAEHAIGAIPETALDPGPFFPVALEAWERLRDLGIRARGRLCLLAERVEAELARLAPLPDPPQDEEASRA